jgi:hypothetical protein
MSLDVITPFAVSAGGRGTSIVEIRNKITAHLASEGGWS